MEQVNNNKNVSVCYTCLLNNRYIDKNCKIFLVIGLIFFLSCFTCSLNAQEIVVDSKITNATVFYSGAQITRKVTIKLDNGNTTIKLKLLSPFIDKNSIRVKAEEGVSILAVNHQINYIKSEAPDEMIRDIRKKIGLYESENQKLSTNLQILEEKLSFLKLNKDFVNNTNNLNSQSYNEMAELYSKKIEEIFYKKLECNNQINSNTRNIELLKKQFQQILNVEGKPEGEIVITLSAKNKIESNLQVTYLVENASWYPSYNIRVDKLDQPVQLVYKANVQQNTGVDWENVKLTFSNASPNRSGVVPKLSAYYLSNHKTPVSAMQKRVYGSGYITGRVTGIDGEPLPGVNVILKGTTNGTVTDLNGEYKFFAPGSGTLNFSYIGYLAEDVSISGQSVLDVQLKTDRVSLDEVVVVRYGSDKNMHATGAVSTVQVEELLQGRIGGMSNKKNITRNEQINKNIEPKINDLVNNTVTSNPVNVEFAIEIPYKVESGGKEIAIDMRYYEVNAGYEYHCVPKIDPEAFLIANIINWKKLNLLNGRANLYFENTFVGRSYLNLDNLKDTLQVSLGRDQNIVVRREVEDEMNSETRVGSNKIEKRSWKYTVKNNNSTIALVKIFDQVPVSIEKDIKVEVDEFSDASYMESTGMLTWKYTLKPQEDKYFKLNYKIKYPTYMDLIIY